MDTSLRDISTENSDTPAPGAAHRLAAVLAQQERTASWLARRTGKSPSYVARVISGERRPSDDFRARAAATLGVPEALLFSEEAAA
jgi:transcriptional regulator with XRE-family HTH domain